MDQSRRTAIDIAEAAYDIQLGPAQWLPNLLEAGGEALDRGSGCAAALWAGLSAGGEPLIKQMHVHNGPPDLAVRFMRAAREVEAGLAARSRKAHGGVSVVSEHREELPDVYRAITQHVGCKDVLGIWALDPDLHGVGINVPSRDRLKLHFKTREHWQMLAVHITAAHRLRRGFGQTGLLAGTPVSEIPLNAEALVDPTRFLVAEARGDARDGAAIATIRQAAIRNDLARGSLRRTDPARALELWQGLVRGRWSLVDWFDSDGRRFVLAHPNAPDLKDPRGLTERERQVATYASLGETNKLIGYRLGISQPNVSTTLRSAMRKLGVQTRPQLVEKLRPFEIVA